ncbi:MAG TPA: phosphohydrolase [Candidatus Moranbacteria bacterium]|nr:phosphohydrolase [Candidatus Moranbacteria bacterium]HBT45474.1 phosphohydrolase [Candidatus Moranbacteria bacterium]
MNKQEIINNTAKYARETLEGETSGHDWWHVYRVWKMAQNIGQKENADMFVVELAALLHDIADYKMHSGDDTVGSGVAREWLEKQGVDDETIFHVCEIIKEASFKGEKVESKINTVEGKVVQDADRLDAIGAIGIARGFMFAGNKSLPMYDPDIKPLEIHDFEVYKNIKRPTYTQINHFYEKLLLLKDLMNTESGKEIAQGRHVIMENYLKDFFNEWEGKA